MEEFLGAVTGGAVWGIGFGLALTAVRTLGGGLRPVAKEAIKGAVSIGDWVRSTAGEAHEGVQDLVHEARSEREPPT